MSLQYTPSAAKLFKVGDRLMKKWHVLLLSAFAFQTVLPANANEELVKVVPKHLTPIIGKYVDRSKLSQDIPFCRGFINDNVINTWFINYFFLYTMNAHSAYQMAGNMPNCSNVDTFKRNPERSQPSFITREQRYRAAVDLFVTKCFPNGSELEKRLTEASRNAANELTCRGYSALTQEMFNQIRAFSF